MARSASSTPTFRALYRRHYGFVWSTVRRFGVGPALTDDAVQDTFVTAFRRFDELSHPSARAWLYGIARRVASNYRRTDERQSRKRNAFEVAQTVSPAATASDAMLVFQRFVGTLEPIDREVFVLSTIEGMSGPEVAQALELNLSTTYSRVQTLRRRFRASLAEAEPRVVMQSARSERPRATAHRWAVLVPHLHATPPLPWPRLGILRFAASARASSITVAMGLALPAAATVGVALAMPRAESFPTALAEVIPAGVSDGSVTATLEPSSVEVPKPPSSATPDVSTPHPPKASRRADDDRDHRLLLEAGVRLREGDGTGALVLTEAHAQEFPHSPLHDARVALRVDALCALGQPVQARREARSLAEQHPHSPLLARIERSCVGGFVDIEDSGQPNQ